MSPRTLDRIACLGSRLTYLSHISVMWARSGPVAGIVSWVVIFTGFFIHGYPTVGASPQELVRWASTTDANRFVAGVFIEDIGWVLFLFFLAWLCQDLWRAGGSHWLLALALASAVVWGGVALGVNGMLDSSPRCWQAGHRSSGAGRNARHSPGRLQQHQHRVRARNDRPRAGCAFRENRAALAGMGSDCHRGRHGSGR